MRRSLIQIPALVAVALLALGACSSSSNKGSTGSPTGVTAGTSGSSAPSGSAIKLGAIAPLTGAAAASEVGVDKAIKGYVKMANDAGGVNGHPIEVTIQDDQSTAAGALAAAKALVEQDHVVAIVSATPFIFGAETYLKSKNIPYFGTLLTEDTNPNAFPIDGGNDPKYPSATTWGQIFKYMGVTKLALLGYGSSPQSSYSVKNIGRSANDAGIKTVYTNLALPFGSTDVGPLVLGMKQAGANGAMASMVQTSQYAIATGVKQNNMNTKLLLLTGYGADLKHSPASAAADGAYFEIPYVPVELGTPAMKQWAADLKKYVGVTDTPNYGVQTGWQNTAYAVYGLRHAGSTITAASIVENLPKAPATDLGGTQIKPFSPGVKNTIANGMGPDNCEYVLQYHAATKTFEVVNNKKPFCGQLIPNSNAAS